MMISTDPDVRRITIAAVIIQRNDHRGRAILDAMAVLALLVAHYDMRMAPILEALGKLPAPKKVTTEILRILLKEQDDA